MDQSYVDSGTCVGRSLTEEEEEEGTRHEHTMRERIETVRRRESTELSWLVISSSCHACPKNR